MTVSKNLTSKEHMIQKTLGTLPMKTFTVSQPLTLSLDLELVIDVAAGDREDATEKFKDIVNDPIELVAQVEELLRMLVEKYSLYRDKNNIIIPRAIVKARTSMKDEEILVIRVKK